MASTKKKIPEFVPKQPNAPSGLSTIRRISSTGKAPKAPVPESEAFTSHDPYARQC